MRVKVSCCLQTARAGKIKKSPQLALNPENVPRQGVHACMSRVETRVGECSCTHPGLEVRGVAL